ncbi:MAG TPA: alpha/beta fold hydrolase [Pyrinomonadaceae bacterium]|jgi:proline iminopeptidase
MLRLTDRRHLFLIAAVLAALLVFAGPASAQAKKLTNGEYRAEINGVAHWYKIAGAEQKTVPLVIIHGGPGGNVYNFERLAGKRLEKFATVIYYEQRGSGRSAAPQDENDYSMPLLIADLEALRRKLGVERMIPLGFSFGGELALEYALAHPAAVDRLILQSASQGDWDRSQRTQIKAFKSISPPETTAEIAAIERANTPLEQRWNEVWNTVDTETVDRLLFYNREAARLNRKMWDESGLKNTGQMYRALRKRPAPEKSLLERARALKIPTLLMVGLYDRNVGVDAVRDLSSAVSDSKLVIFERSGHFPDIEETDKYVRVVREFISRRN